MSEGVTLDLANYQASALLALLSEDAQVESPVWDSMRKRLRELAAVNHWPDVFTMPEPESVAINEAADIPDRGHVANQLIGNLERQVDDLGALLATATGELDEQIVMRELAEKQRDEARAELQVASTQHIGVVTNLQADLDQSGRDREVLADHVAEAEKALAEIGVERTVRLTMVPGIQAVSGTSIAHRIRWLEEQRKVTAAAATELQRHLAHERAEHTKTTADLRAISQPVPNVSFKQLTHDVLDLVGVPYQPSTPRSSGHRVVDRIRWLNAKALDLDIKLTAAREAERVSEDQLDRLRDRLRDRLEDEIDDATNLADVARAASAGNTRRALPIALPTPNHLNLLRFDIAGSMYEVGAWHTLRYPAEIALTLVPEREDDNG